MLRWLEFVFYSIAVQVGAFSAEPLLKGKLSFEQASARLGVIIVAFAGAFWLGEYRIGGRRMGPWPPVGFRRQVISKVLYSVSCYSVLLLGGSLFFQREHLAGIAAFAAVCVFLALAWGRGTALLRQSIRDHLAAAILKGSNTQFVLLLRPFHTIGHFDVSERVPASIDQILDPVSFAPHRDVDMETHICAALDGDAVIALGWEQPIVGAGKIETSDADWFDVFKDLAQRAATILLIPLGGEGTTTEIEWLINNQHLSKIVFMCPPSQKQDLGAVWENTQAEFRERWGIQIPAHVASGAFFRFAIGKADPISHCFESFSQKEILQAFRSVSSRVAHSSPA